MTPSQLVKTIAGNLASRGDDGIWITTLAIAALLARADELESIAPAQRQHYPLWGIPFSVKDCIDVAGLPTSAACPAFAYEATQTNPVIQALMDAGAILIGKTNLDQFATGLVGIRTGYTMPGGSSSGAALSVAGGLVSFAIGTDTGGSGRVPAAMNNIVGLKPTRGLLSTRHTVEACKTLDCLSIFALTATDADTVFQLTQGLDPDHSFSRDLALQPQPLPVYDPPQSFCFGVPRPEQREFFGNGEVKTRYEKAIATLTTLGGTGVEIDYTPFLQANELLFNGAWVAERYASVGQFIEANPAAAFPITQQILMQAKTLTAVEAFEGLYAVEALTRTVQPLWEAIDCLVVPPTGTAYRIDEIEADPLRLNANLGYYTNFVNLLDLAAIALPSGFQSNGIHTGVTLIAPPWHEAYLVSLGSAFQQQQDIQLGATAFTTQHLAPLTD